MVKCSPSSTDFSQPQQLQRSRSRSEQDLLLGAPNHLAVASNMSDGMRRAVSGNELSRSGFATSVPEVSDFKILCNKI